MEKITPAYPPAFPTSTAGCAIIQRVMANGNPER